MSCEVVTRIILIHTSAQDVIGVNWGLTPIELVLQGDICDLRSKTSERYFRFAVRSIECARPGRRLQFAVTTVKGELQICGQKYLPCLLQGSNLRLVDQESTALPIELRGHIDTNGVNGKGNILYVFCVSRITCYELTPHLVMLARKENKDVFCKLTVCHCRQHFFKRLTALGG